VTAGANASATGVVARWARLGLSAQIIIGLAAGILVGLFFGEPAAALQPLADIYIRLMQMTVLPYLVLTLIVGLGQLDAAEAKRLAVRGGLLLVVFWVLALAVIGLMPLAFPRFESASFFSHALIEPHQPFALHEIYVPANPFNALANAIVPAVVLFSAAVGVALIGIANKAGLLGNLRTLEQAVVRVTRFVIALTPIGVFAIAAVAAGTMDPATFVRLEVYFATFAVASLLLAFVVLPLAVTAVTPFRYREVVSLAKEALLTAFVANSAFIVLPILVERANALMARHGLRTPDAESTVEVLIPVAFTFPNAGRLLTLLFVPSGAWLAGDPLAPESYASLFGAGLFAYFAKAQVALPFLMDLVGVPHDFFQLYIPTTILTGKFDSMTSAMALFAMALIGAAAMTGFLRLQAARLGKAFAMMAIAVAAAVFATRLVLAATVDTAYHKDELLRGMHLPRGPIPAIVRTDVPPPEIEPIPALDRIRARGTLRVAFVPDALPFTFFNARNELVGMDVELAGQLARALGVVALEFVPGDYATVVRLLAEGRADLVMTLAYTRDALSVLRFSAPHFDGVLGLAVRDARRHEFATLEAIARRGPLTIGVLVDTPALEEAVREYLQGAELRFEPAPPRDYFSGRRPDIDAFALFASSGSAWSLLYPAYSVVVPQPRPLHLPAGVAMRRADRDLAEFVDEWLVIARSSGALQRAYDYWVLGKGAEATRRRWSIMHDVLGWGR
jgi:Na+/H+-dicarboxylate symporter